VLCGVTDGRRRRKHSCDLQVRDSLTQRASEFNILVDDVAITHLSFGTEVSLRILARSGCSLLEAIKANAVHQIGPSFLGPITPFSPPQFTKAVEAKQVAQQDAERAKFVVMKADQVCIDTTVRV
jgi:prohibitin 1